MWLDQAMSNRRRLWLLPLAVFAALVCIQGGRHHWRLEPGPVTIDCTTREVDDGCSMLGVCFKCAPPACPAAGQPVLVAVLSCGH